MSMTGNLLKIPGNIEIGNFGRNELFNLLLEYLDTNHHLDVDKYWHGLHFLLTDNPWGNDGVKGCVVLGGTFLWDEDEDEGFGPPVYKDPNSVVEIAKYIQSLSEEKLMEQYDAEIFNENGIYPDIWEDDTIEELIATLKSVKEFYSDAADNNEAIVFWVL